MAKAMALEVRNFQTNALNGYLSWAGTGYAYVSPDKYSLYWAEDGHTRLAIVYAVIDGWLAGGSEEGEDAYWTQKATHDSAAAIRVQPDGTLSTESDNDMVLYQEGSYLKWGNRQKHDTTLVKFVEVSPPAKIDPPPA